MIETKINPFSYLFYGPKTQTLQSLGITLFNYSRCLVKCSFGQKKENVERLKYYIDNNYTINYVLDGLPAGYNKTDASTKTSVVTYNQGIPIGYIGKKGKYYLYNHYNIYIDYHNNTNKTYNIIGFNIEPISMMSGDCIKSNDNSFYFKMKLELEQAPLYNISFTYNTYFRRTNKTFEERWEYYLGGKSNIHWLGLINSNLLIFVVSFLVGFILIRALRKDIEMYNKKVVELTGEIIDEFGWKNVCYDVFRKPSHNLFLSSLVGAGVQIMIIVFESIIFSVLGFMKPELRANIIGILILSFICSSFAGGYAGVVMYRISETTKKGKNFKSQTNKIQWLKCSLLSSLVVPTIVLMSLIIIRFTYYLENSSNLSLSWSDSFLSVFEWIVALIAMITLSVSGGGFAMSTSKFTPPCKVNNLPTSIGPLPCCLRVRYMFFLTGLIPFATIVIEFIYVMTSIWKHQIYFLASFASFATVFIIVSSSEIAIIVVYLSLCKGDYRWWWKAFFIGASPCLYIVLYSVYYIFYIGINRISAIILYFLVMSVFTCSVGIACGGCSLLSTLVFLMVIYSKIKID